jgi:hypothetical protein
MSVVTNSHRQITARCLKTAGIFFVTVLAATSLKLRCHQGQRDLKALGKKSFASSQLLVTLTIVGFPWHGYRPIPVCAALTYGLLSCASLCPHPNVLFLIQKLAIGF